MSFESVGLQPADFNAAPERTDCLGEQNAV